MQIYIHRNNEDFGPYSREAVQEYVKRGVFQACDYACYAGMSDWKTLSDLLGIGDSSGAGRIRKFVGDDVPPGLATTNLQKRTQPIVRPARRRFRRTGTHGRAGLIALNLVLVAIVAAGIYIKTGGAGALAQRYLAAVSNSIATAIAKAASQTAHVVSTPPPVAEATPAVMPPQPALAPIAPVVAAPVVPAATPAPPKPFDPADLAGNPAAWPATVHLKQPASFPALDNNAQIIGSVTVPPGTAVRLTKIIGDQVTLDYQGGTQTVSWKATDLEEQATKLTSSPAATPVAAPAAAVAPVSQAAPAAPSSPVAGTPPQGN